MPKVKFVCGALQVQHYDIDVNNLGGAKYISDMLFFVHMRLHGRKVHTKYRFKILSKF